jgi:hypothetical protein
MYCTTRWLPRAFTLPLAAFHLLRYFSVTAFGMQLGVGEIAMLR